MNVQASFRDLHITARHMLVKQIIKEELPHINKVIRYLEENGGLSDASKQQLRTIFSFFYHGKSSINHCLNHLVSEKDQINNCNFYIQELFFTVYDGLKYSGASLSYNHFYFKECFDENKKCLSDSKLIKHTKEKRKEFYLKVMEMKEQYQNQIHMDWELAVSGEQDDFQKLREYFSTTPKERYCKDPYKYLHHISVENRSVCFDYIEQHVR